MRPQPLRNTLVAALLIALLPGCDPKTPPPEAKSENSPAPKTPAEPKTPEARKLRDRLATVAAQAAKRRPYLQRFNPPIDEGPAGWPVTVPLGPGHRAIPPVNPPKTTALPTAGSGCYLTVSNPPIEPREWHRVGNGGPVWKSVNSMPTLPGTGGSQHQVNQNGSRTEYDADDGTKTVYNANGSTDTLYPNGDDVHTYGPGGGPDGMVGYDSHSDGTTTTYNSDGSSTTYNSNGSVDDNNTDGSQSHVYGPGGGPGGDVGYVKNPDGSTTAYHNDGSSTSTDPNGNSIDNPGPTGEKYSQDPAGGPNGKDWSNPPGDHPAKGTGEPHYYTRDGAEVTTQAAGEFVLVTGVPGRELQARHQPWNNTQTASAVTALAMRVGGNKVEVRLDGTVLINGETAPAGGFVQGDLPGGGAVGAWRKDDKLTGAVVIWPDLSVVWVTMGHKYLNLVVQWRTLAPEHRGLLGSNDGDVNNDLTDRAGTVHARGDAAGVAAFVESWRVTDAESLFTYAPGESTATYTLRDFPKNPPDPAAHRAEAEAAVADLPPGLLRESCLYDIAVTGDVRFAGGYRDFAKLSATVQANSDLPPPRKKQNAAMATPAPSPSPTATSPVESGTGIEITPAEMAAAAPMVSHQEFKLKLGAGESRVYKFQPGKDENLTIYPADLKSVAAYRPGQEAGFAWFDDKGKMVGKPHPADADGPSPMDHPTGTFYLKIVGPGDVDIQHH